LNEEGDMKWFSGWCGDLQRQWPSKTGNWKAV